MTSLTRIVFKNLDNSLLSRLIRGDVPKVVYGRWGTEYSTQQLDSRIDLANEDHCGPCGNYSLEKTNEMSYKKMNSTQNKNSKKRQITTNEKYNSCSGDYFAMMNE